MKSRTPKVLHKVLGRTMLAHVLASVERLNVNEHIIVTDPASARLLEPVTGASVAIQRLPLGTADAVAAGLDCLKQTGGSVLILNGDVPLVRSESLTRLVERHQAANALLTVGTFSAPGDARYGRVMRRDGRVVGVREAAEDSHDRSAGFEANGGIYCVDVAWLREHVGKVRVSPSGEYYVTALIEMAFRSASDARGVETVEFEEDELLGVDDRRRLAHAEAILRRRVIEVHLRAGVTIIDPARTVIEPEVRICSDVTIEPGCVLRGSTSIGEGSVIGPYAVIESAVIGRDCTILQSWVEEATIGDRVRVGPFARLRAGTVIDRDVFIGNFVETKATSIGAESDVHHVTYLGDAVLGTNVNIGAGTITCNYDGVEKHRTVIGNDVFVGCDTMLVAPVELGAGSKTGAGAVVTRSVPPGQTVVGIPARPIERPGPAHAQEEHGR